MPKLRPPNPDMDTDWYLPHWMDELSITQADMQRKTGWGKSTTNQIYHGGTRYYRTIINEAALALDIEPYELLMHPEDAMAIRRMRKDAVRIAADNRTSFKKQPELKAVGEKDD